MDSVKREYRSALRNAQAEATRRTLVDAAAQLYVERGYAATTVDAIAEAAGISRKTVFTSVGGKPELLKTALDWAVAGDDLALAVADRPETVRILAQDDPALLIAGWVRLQVDIDRRAARLYHVLEVAAESDESARELLLRYQRQRLAGARTVIGRLDRLDALGSALRRSEAVDIAWLATDPALYNRLVITRGWSVTRFERWLVQLIQCQLLADPAGRNDATRGS